MTHALLMHRNARREPPSIIGLSPALHRARQLIERYAPSRLSVLVQGATGTGKELVAQHIHYLSGRPGDLVDVNCGALPREIAESLLFGHRRGAFTGAVASVTGHIERAHGKTLFLDELLDLPPDCQVKLLRVLETGEVQRLGEGEKRPVDVRVVAAAQEDLSDRLATGRFRRDLYQRIAGVVIHLPPLVERPEDIQPMAAQFAALLGRVLDARCDRVLTRYDWPGNARELRFAIERATQLGDDGTLSPAALAEAIALGAPGARGRTPTVRFFPSQHALMRVCEANDWHPRQIAAALGVARSTLYYRLRADGLSLRALRQSKKSNGQSMDSLD